MNLRRISIKSQAKIFDSYSSLDVPIVKKASFLGLALMGGTAVQFLARQLGVKERRQRSINDIDFIVSHSNRNIRIFEEFLKKEGFEPIKMGSSEYMLNYENKKVGVEVDVAITWDTNIGNQIETYSNILVWSPIWMFVSKVQRITTKSTKTESDSQDLNTLYDIIEKMGRIPELEEALSKEDMSEENNKMIEDIIAKG